MLGYLWGGGEGLAAALGDVGRWRGCTPGTECVQGRPERGTSVSGVVLVSLDKDCVNPFAPTLKLALHSPKLAPLIHTHP